MKSRVYTLTCTWAESYGAVLQAFALARAINSLGFDARIINYQPPYDLTSRARRALARIYRPKFMDFLRDSRLLTDARYRDLSELRRARLRGGAFVVGSDQVWNCTKYANGKDDAMFLDFADDGARRVSYAASLAMPEVPADQAARYKRLLDEFDAVSVREATGIEALRAIGVDAQVVVDPVYLLGRDEWGQLAAKGSRNFAQEKYVLVVCLEQRESVYEYARRQADRLGVPLYSLSNGPRAFKKHARVDRNFRELSVYDYLSIVRGAEAIVTDSFHAMSFSLIFNRDVSVMLRGDTGDARMVDLLGELGVDNRVADPASVHEERIDFGAVNEAIKQKVDAGMDFLQSSLKGLPCGESV